MWYFEFPFDWYRKIARHWLVWLASPLAFYSWTLTGPFVSDDLHLVLKTEQYLKGERGDLELYQFAKSDEEWREMCDRGNCPWWIPPTGRLDLFRPLAELSFYLDVLLFGRNPLGYRLVSLFVFAVAILSVHRLFMVTAGDAVLAGTATYFYAISQTLAPPVTWMCNRHDLFVVIGTSIAAAAYWEACHRPRVKHLIVAVAAFAFALLSKEMAVALAGVIGLHEIIQRVRAKPRSDRRMAGAIAAALILMASAYLVYYVYSRPWAFSVAGGDGSPSQLGAQLPLSLLLYAAVWTLGFPIDVLHAASDVQVFSVAGVAGVVLVITIICLRKSVRHEPAALFFILWAILFIVPGLRALTASSRMLCVATIGWSYLLAGLLITPRPRQRPAPLPLRAWLNLTNMAVSIGCIIGTVLLMNSTEVRARQRMERAVAALPTPLQDGDTLVFDRAESSFEIMAAGDRLEFLTHRRNVAAMFLLGPGIEASLTPEDPHTIVARSKNGDLFNSPIHLITLGRTKRPRLGKRYRVRQFEAEVSEIGKDNGVREVQFRFREPLASPHLHFDPPELAITTHADRAALRVSTP